LGHFKHSAASTAELENFAESELRRLQQDVHTRWNSVLIMLQSLLQARKAITIFMSSERNHFNIPNLSDSDWDKISNYVKVLDLFCQATVLLGGQKYVSCSCVLPLLKCLTKHMAVNDNNPGYIARFKVASIDDFTKRVVEIKSIESLKIATALDPRYKNLKCLTEDLKERVWTRIKEKLTTYAYADQVETNEQSHIDTANEILYKSKDTYIKLIYICPDIYANIILHDTAQMIHSESVSYTHLTLPTIYSV